MILNPTDVDLHPAVFDHLRWEAELVPDASPDAVLAVRVQLGLILLEDGDARPFWWDSPKRTATFNFNLPPDLISKVDAWVNLCAPRDVMLSAFAVAVACEPAEVREARVRRGLEAPLHPAVPVLTRERCYLVDLSSAGHTLRHIVGNEFVGDVMEHAVLALAREICRTGRCGDAPMSPGVREFARALLEEEGSVGEE